MQRVSFVIVIMLFVASSISAIRVNAIPGGEPPLEDILDSVGYTQRTLLSTETFAPCTYKITMYAEYAGFRDSNQLRWYKVGTSTFNLIFDGPEGVPPGDPMGMVSPPLTKSFMIGDSFGLSLLSPDGTFYTETTKNIDAQKHAKIYQSQTDPNVYLVGFENMGAQSHSDFDYNDMVVSLEKIQYYLTVKTDPTGVATVPGEGWYDASATATLTAPPVSGNYRFSNWDVDGTSQGSNVNPIGVTMNGPHTATAHYILVNVPALWISPKTNVFSGPCIVSTNFQIDVNLFNKKAITGYGVFAYDFYLEWANNTGTLGESMISLVGINLHVPWTTGSYFIVANQTIMDVSGYSYYHLAITAIGNASLELTEFQGSLVTLTFHIDNEPCWPTIYTNTFHIIGNASLSTQCTQFIPVELDDATYELDAARPNIESMPAKTEKGYPDSINETFIGNTHIVEVHLTNVTKAYGFSFVLTYDPLYWKIDYQHFSICASFSPPYETLVVNMHTPGTISFELLKPCEKPAVCGAVVCAVSFSFVSTSPDVGKIPTPFTGAFCLTAASVFEKCPQLTEYSILNGGLLYGGCLPFYWGPCKTDITLDGKTDIADLSALAKKYGLVHPWGALATSGDTTKVDIYDFVQIAKHFGICLDP